MVLTSWARACATAPTILCGTSVWCINSNQSSSANGIPKDIADLSLLSLRSHARTMSDQRSRMTLSNRS